MLGNLNLNTIGWRLARLDKHLISVISERVGKGRLSNLVAKTKQKDKSHPVRKDVEDKRLAMAVTWAREHGVDENLAASILYGLIAESCREQSAYIFENPKIIDENDQEAVKEYYRDELLRLTKDVARTYDDAYGKDFFGTNLYLEFENGLLNDYILNNGDDELALDLGCATGRIGLMLGKKFKNVIGFDISPEMVSVAEIKRAEAGLMNTIFKVHDLETGIPLGDNSVSAVVMNMGTMSDIVGIESLLSEISRVLKQEGKFLFSFYNSGSLALQFGFLPWPTSLAAMIDREKNALDVRVGPNLYQIHARPYSVEETKKIIMEAGLGRRKIYTYPTVSSVLPDDIMSTDTFGAYDNKQNQEGRCRPAQLNKEPVVEAQKSLRQIDLLLSESELALGSYIVITGKK